MWIRARYWHESSVTYSAGIQVPAVLGAAWEEGYRHRLKLPVQVGRDHVRIGLLDANDRILDTPDCPVLEPGLRDALARVLVWMRGRNGIHSLDLRRSSKTGEVQAVFACLGGDLSGGAKAARGRDACQVRLWPLWKLAMAAALPNGVPCS